MKRVGLMQDAFVKPRAEIVAHPEDIFVRGPEQREPDERRHDGSQREEAGQDDEEIGPAGKPDHRHPVGQPSVLQQPSRIGEHREKGDHRSERQHLSQRPGQHQRDDLKELATAARRQRPPEPGDDGRGRLVRPDRSRAPREPTPAVAAHQGCIPRHRCDTRQRVRQASASAATMNRGPSVTSRRHIFFGSAARRQAHSSPASPIHAGARLTSPA